MKYHHQMSWSEELNCDCLLPTSHNWKKINENLFRKLIIDKTIRKEQTEINHKQ